MGSFKLKLVLWFALLALLPLAVAFYGYDSLASRSETRRADAGLQSALRSAVAVYAARLDVAGRDAAELASSPALQQALRAHDRAALARLVGALPNASVSARGLRVGATGVQDEAVRTVTVLAGTHELGKVSVHIPFDRAFLAALGAGLPSNGRVLVVRSGRIVAGPARGRLTLRPGHAARVSVGGKDYRGLQTAQLAGQRGLEVAVLTPHSSIVSAAHAARTRIIAALLASLLLIAAVTYLLGRSIVLTLRRVADAANAIARGRFDERVAVRGTDEFAQMAGAFNHMAAQLEQRLAELDTERLRVRDATTRFGETLVATHDADQLARVIVEAAVGATGATSGMVLGPRGEVARTGDLPAGRETIAFPLRAGSSDFGSLVLAADSFDAEQIQIANFLATQAVVALENVRLHGIVEQQALLDGLTGLANRRSVEETLRSELARVARFGGGGCLVLADLDDFKRVNDDFGHPVGDEVLKTFAQTLRDTVRESDTAARWGGEEFALVLTGTDTDGGAHLAERARAAIEAEVLSTDGGDVAVTASFGVAAFNHTAQVDELVAAADAALYQAKRTGKNRVVVSAPALPPKMV